jgi:predicted transcriptional regulator of viral defense system
MNYQKLRQLKDKNYFSSREVASVLDVKTESSKVICWRLLKRGVLIRLKRDFYILREKWDILTKEDFFNISNILQVPSYISFMSSLTYYEVSTQVYRNFFENVTVKRTNNFEIEGTIFNYYKIQKDLFFGFVKSDNFFISEKEKAFVDILYLHLLGRYEFDLNSISLNKLNKKRIEEFLTKYPIKTEKLFKKIWKN